MAVKDTVTRILITAKDEASGVFGTLQRNAGKVAAAIVGFFGVKLFAGATESAEGLDVQMRKLDAAVRATGGAAGLTAEEIDQMARRLDEATLGSAEGFRNAAAQLLTFKSVGSDAFETVLELAQDLADTGFGTLETNVVQLGKALEDPIRGLTALRRSGVSFTAEQENVIKSLVETGRAAEAQGLILEAVSGQVGGVARSMGTGLSGAVDLVKARFTELQQQLGAAILPSLQRFNERIADLYGRLRDSGAIERFGQIIASVFEKAQQSFFAFVDQIDLDALIAKLTAWANATQQTVATWAENLTTASNVARVTFGAIGTGIDTIKTAFFTLTGTVQLAAFGIANGFAIILETINNVTGKFGEAATAVRDLANTYGDAAQGSFASAAAALDDTANSAGRLRDSFGELVSPAEKTADALQLAADSTESLNAAAGLTADELDALGEGFEFVDGEARKAAAGIETTAQAAGSAAGALGDAADDAVLLAEAYKELGITSSAELEKAAERAKVAFDRIKASGTASVEDIQRAFRAYAERAIAANGGVADSTVQAVATLAGMRIEADETGRAIVVAMTAAADATRLVGEEAAGAAGEFQGLADAATRAAEAIQKAEGKDRKRTGNTEDPLTTLRRLGLDIDVDDESRFRELAAFLTKKYMGQVTNAFNSSTTWKEALRNQQAALERAIREAEEQVKRERGGSSTGGTTATTTTRQPAASGASSGSSIGPVSITINDARDPEKVARQVAKELDKIRRFAK